MTDSLDRLTVGSHVFHPAHGVAVVASIEKRDLGGAQQEFYTLELVMGGKLLLPKGNVERVGIRTLISEAEATELSARVRTEPELDDTPWRERTAQYAETLKGGAAEEYTETLRQLLFRSRSSKLTTTERRLLDTAIAYFVGEIGLVLERSAEELEKMLADLADPAQFSGAKSTD